MKKLILVAVSALIVVGCGDSDGEKARKTAKSAEAKLNSMSASVMWLRAEGFDDLRGNYIPSHLRNDEIKLTEARAHFANIAKCAHDVREMVDGKRVRFKDRNDAIMLAVNEMWANNYIQTLDARLAFMNSRKTEAPVKDDGAKPEKDNGKPLPVPLQGESIAI